MRLMCRSLVLMLPILLTACGSGGDGDNEEILVSDNGGTQVALGMDEDDSGLGSVNLPRPDWLPADFPLPADTHIFITVAKPEQTPPIYMIQARTHEDGEEIADAFVAWAKTRGLESDRLQSHSDEIHLASLAKGNGLENASLQVHDKEGGVKLIILAVTGLPWQ